jgi:glycosyltransferase involved in cell wall biosynthesis
MNILAYVHLRNIHHSTGHGRVARQITEHLARGPADQLRILADPDDHRNVVEKVGPPWTGFSYHFFEDRTSRQQVRWALTDKPLAEYYWPEAQIVYSTCESYVPTRKARLVVTLHDAAIFESGVFPGRWLFYRERLKLKVFHGMVSRKADLIHTVSRFSAERIAHFFPAVRSRLRVVPNAVSPRFFLPVSGEGEDFLRAEGLADRPFILLPGGLNRRKNADMVLKAWPLIHGLHGEVRLVVAGNCDASYLATAGAMGDSIKLTGYVSDEALCALYQAARLVWFPSLYEGFGMPILEAMAQGTPVVSSNCTSIPEVAGDAGVLVSPESVNENVEALDLLLSDSRRREALGERGRIRAQQFTWERTVSELRRQFLSLL